jgi:poly(glycerol-phosphate) alpha-glucosyltransferase
MNSMFRRPLFTHKARLPKLPIYLLTHSIPENSGGVTAVVLGRSNEFVRSIGSDVTLLTLSAKHAMSLESLREELVSQDRLDPRVHLRNAWADVIDMPDRELRAMSGSRRPYIPVEAPPFNGMRDVRTRRHDDSLMEIDRYRADGSVAIIDQRSIMIANKMHRRIITAFDRDGAIIQQWRSEGSMYRSWITWLTKNADMAILLAERLTSADVLTNWDAENVAFVQTIHSNHVTARDSSRYAFPPPKGVIHEQLFDSCSVSIT